MKLQSKLDRMPPTRTRATTCAVSPVEVDMEEIDELDPSSEDETGSQLVPKPRIWADVKSYKNIPLLSDEEKVALTVRNSECLQVLMS